MFAPFDEIAKQAFHEVAIVMGEKAVWHSSNESGDIEGMVLFKDPSEADQIGSGERYEYEPDGPVVEYYAGTFAGLKESVDAENPEYLAVHGRQYAVISVAKIVDGNTFKARLKPHKNED